MVFLVREVLPVEVAETLLLLLMVVLTFEHCLGHAYGLEAIGHLRHVAFIHTHCHRCGILEQMVGPWEWIGVEREGAAPDRGAARRVQDAHARAAFTRSALLVAPAQILQPGDQVGDSFEPVAIDELGLVRFLHAVRNLRERQLSITCSTQDRGHFLDVTGIDRASQLEPDVLFELGDKIVELCDLRFHARLHQRLYRGDEQVDDGFLGATMAGAIAAGKG